MNRFQLYLIAFVLLLTGACNKQDNATRVDQYRNIFYKIQLQDSNLAINFQRAVYNSTQKGNIGKDSLLVNPGNYTIPATVLTGMEVPLYGESKVSNRFSMQITDEHGTVLAKTDSISFDPANPLHPDTWRARIQAVIQ